MKTIYRQFVDRQKSADDWDYLNSTILLSTAPTIAGLKPATLIYLWDSGRNLKSLWEKQRERFFTLFLPRLKVQCCELSVSPKYISVLFYEESILEKWLYLSDVRQFLNRYGNNLTSVAGIIAWIKVQLNDEFPHEIGAILGYPPADIEAFIRNKGNNYQLNGYWKVYYHPVSALYIFKLYDHAKAVVMEYFINKWDKLNI